MYLTHELITDFALFLQNADGIPHFLIKSKYKPENSDLGFIPATYIILEFILKIVVQNVSL
jgi:hypothetical protein